MDVDFCGNGVTSVGAIALAAGITASNSLAAVALDNNDLREEGGRALLKVRGQGVTMGESPWP